MSGLQDFGYLVFVFFGGGLQVWSVGFGFRLWSLGPSLSEVLFYANLAKAAVNLERHVIAKQGFSFCAEASIKQLPQLLARAGSVATIG